jgi:hypothetical protein
MKAAILIFTLCFYWGMSTRLHFSTTETLSPTFQEIKTMGILGVIYNHIPIKNPQVKEGLRTKWHATKEKAKQYKWLMALLGFGGFWQLTKWRKKVLNKRLLKRDGDFNTKGCLKMMCLIFLASAALGFVVGLIFPALKSMQLLMGFGIFCIICIIFSGKLKHMA